MGYYITLHQTQAAYDAVKDSLPTPQVALVKENMTVNYKPYYVHDYSQDYLTTVALENGTISFNILDSMGTDMITSISYSTNDGESWTTTNNLNDKVEHLTISVEVSEGDKVLWKGDAQQLGYYDDFDYLGSFFSSDCEFNVQGNVMSMLYGDDFIGEDTLNYSAEFVRLFFDYNMEHRCLVVSAEHMVLPATTLATYCYREMFAYCKSLTAAPQLPATKLANNCYANMFYGCTSLTAAPQLPATTLANNCYELMFQGCTSLTTAPVLSATTLAENCYNGMFSYCTSLTTAPELSATTLARYCYANMFSDCTSLTTAPQLPATTLANWCYGHMFANCTSLTTAPQLPATTLANWCYGHMFYKCTSLTTAPELPATTLANYCYQQMFQRCTSLNSIKCLATNISASNCTNSWLDGVAASGTFTKASSMSSWTSGTSGIPNGWTVVDAQS